MNISKGRMNRLFVTVAVVFVMTSQAASQPKKSDLEQIGLVGPVRSVTTERESPGKPRMKTQTVTFDAAGKKTEEINYSESGAIAHRTTYSYDARGNLIDRNQTDGNGVTISKTRHNYDSNGSKTEELSYSADGQLSSKTVFVYDSAGRLSEETHKGAKDNWFDGTTQYVYDEQGRLVNQKSNTKGMFGSARSDGSFRVVATYRYDDRGLLVEKTETGITGEIRTRFVYDLIGKLTRKVTSSILPRTVDYDEKGNPVKEFTEGFRYGSAADPEITYRYQFDSRGNWIQQTITRTTMKEASERIPGSSVFYPTRRPSTEVIQTNYRMITYHST